ncbi:triose-phosphate isomerase [Sphingosinicella ginsenosidimutans]|uniref:Triosephosphate isomerase n=1 Tax=Allosphingosinicella ginsenosidimutans TaxID=1176539 RepID=A0A5C6TXU6_9SPHN|nr:triose-phosphate isomerase [Sphingosinicella ginsenosidimutans]TXC64578.1 triose-phosphate isomerase [Sphingosinicella ginsenosidimutans]
MHLRRKLIAGNWKMNGNLAALAEIAATADAAREIAGVDVAICPPFTLIAPAVTRSGGLVIGAQDCHAAESGAHTGCVSASMAKEAGARLVIVGHSERRADQHESDADVRAKAETALRHGLTAIVCVGESEGDRAARGHVAVVERQLAGSLPDSWEEGELVVAYEPIWAIGTGKVATPADIGEMHGAIRAALVQRFGDLGDRIRILYGGSVKADNAAAIFGVANVDGALVGGASLTAAQFVPIIEAAAAS